MAPVDPSSAVCYNDSFFLEIDALVKWQLHHQGLHEIFINDALWKIYKWSLVKTYEEATKLNLAASQGVSVCVKVSRFQC